MSILIKGMEMPEDDMKNIMILADGRVFQFSGYGNPKPLGTVVPVPSHGRLIDADALVEDLKRQCEEVFKIDAVSPDDFWITRDQAYNERLWKTWCESFYKYLESRPTVIPASGEG
jgi:hypothetical protein